MYTVLRSVILARLMLHLHGGDLPERKTDESFTNFCAAAPGMAPGIYPASMIYATKQTTACSEKFYIILCTITEKYT